MKTISLVSGVLWLPSFALGAEGSTLSMPQIGITGSAVFNMFSGSQSNREIEKVKKDANTDALSSDPSSYETGGPSFTTDNTKIAFQVDGQMDFATFHQWMATMMLSGDRFAKTHYIVPQAYISLYSKYATLNLGNYAGVEDLMSFGGASLLGGTGGFGSSAHRGYVGITTGCYAKVELVGDSDDATKFTLMTPRFWGFQLGVSYTPDTSKIGRKNRVDLGPISDTDIYYNKQFWGFGVNFVEFVTSDAKLSLSVTGVTGSPRTAQTGPNGEDIYFHQTNGVTVGGDITFDKVALGAEYGWMGQTAQMKGNYLVAAPGVAPSEYVGAHASAPRFFDVAIAFFFWDTKLALGYYRSEAKTGFAVDGKTSKAVTNIGNASLTYAVQPGVQIYIEGFYHLTKNPSALYEMSLFVQQMKDFTKGNVIRDQRALTGVVGVKVSF
ncbi:hypothetical protein [Candidatus Hepatobacter penaei]|uniref:hypothetical protein n=1 Tax=Candidatus Hepatobacter penaei TaxID=1274402 RepID=UPI0012DFFC5C|nr:hypothetical protein [Candidatus Hepatobacter penaei]